MPVSDPNVGIPIFKPLSSIENGFKGLMKPPDEIDSLMNCKHDVQGAVTLTATESKLVCIIKPESCESLVANTND